MSWNLQATPYKRVERAQLIFDRIFRANLPDVLLLQEVNRDVRKAILADPKLRGGFLMSDADSEDDSAFFPFSTMTLLSRKRFAAGGVSSGEDQLQKMVISDAFRMTLPSRDDRDALCIDVSDPVTPGHVLRLINVHLESLDAAFRRGFQLYLMNALLREAGCSGGVIAGSFNAFEPYDLTLVEQHGLLDAWVKLHGPLPGPTWGTGVDLDDGLQPARLDKVVMLGLEPAHMEVIPPGRFDNGIPWSDHCGLRCTFVV